MLRNNEPFLYNDKCALYLKVLQQAQLNQICIQMTTAACTPPTQNSIEMCEERTYEEADGQLLLSVPHSVIDSMTTNSKNKNIFTFRRVNLIYFIYKNKGLNIGRLSSYLTENMASFH